MIGLARNLIPLDAESIGNDANREVLRNVGIGIGRQRKRVWVVRKAARNGVRPLGAIEIAGAILGPDNPLKGLPRSHHWAAQVRPVHEDEALPTDRLVTTICTKRRIVAVFGDDVVEIALDEGEKADVILARERRALHLNLIDRSPDGHSGLSHEEARDGCGCYET